jgi:pyridinium-3,5-biscarboxylic acid mononucleotide synthase
MNRKQAERTLKDLKSGKISDGEALDRLMFSPYEDIGCAKLDTHRELRKGFPEVVYCRGKTLCQLKKIFSREGFIMGTKAEAEMFEAVSSVRKDAKYYEEAKIIAAGKRSRRKKQGYVLVVSAGTSDIPVAEEAAVTAELMGSGVERLYDVGVAGIHRLLINRKKLFAAKSVIVAAGMDGALPSVVGGLVQSPVIAVPTSVGYGAGFKGVSALLTMLNTCAPGVVVVNIDNGFGAGYFAGVL